MKGDPACKSEMTAMRSPLKFAGQDGNVIRVSRRTSREGSITDPHMAGKARQQSSASKMILARERPFLFPGCSGAERACPKFNIPLDGFSIHSRQAWMEMKSRPQAN